MVSNVSPNLPPRETNSSKPIKPNESPRGDRFRKTYKEGHVPSKNEQERASLERRDHDSPPSVFDLSKKSPVKHKTFTKDSNSKEASPNGVQKRQLSPRETNDHNLTLTENEKENQLGNEITQEPLEDHLFSASEENVAMADSSSTEGKPIEQQMPDPLKKPVDHSHLTSLHRQQGPILSQNEKPKKTESSTFDSKEGNLISKKDKTKSSTSSSVSSEEEQRSKAMVNPDSQSVAFYTEKAQESEEVSRPAMIKELAAQMIDRIQVMRKENQTSTIITLRHPPLLEGATITLTAFDHAKKEFNISFANLSPDAKVFLDRKLREDSLTETLERKGIIVHALTTTTQTENLLNIEAGQPSQDQQEQQREQRRQREREQEEEF